MRYLIDGHNLIGQMPDLSLADPDDEAKLVLRLVEYAAGRNARIVVVFDRGLPAGHSRLSRGPVQAVFAGSHTDADTLLRERIRAETQPGQLIVVSEDREVIAAAKARKITVTRSSEFARQLAVFAPRPPRRRGPSTNDDRKLSDSEVEEWLRLFGEDKNKP
jgi:predicted RNA-binding protein with PIN domain